ncbi:MAG: DUF933 domain-containing protein [Deltaproteobacteria bacterium]|nr:DUF933 domain-containing protein [Deltaproteobacteria bacterium]
MKICLIDIPGIPLGKHNIRDPRLDLVDELVTADKKTYVQTEIVSEEGLAAADCIVVHKNRQVDLILQDLEFIDTRLGRQPGDAEKAVLLKLAEALGKETFASEAALSEEEKRLIAANALATAKPVVVADPEELETPEALMVRAYQESGYISFLTVGGRENRAWTIRRGCTAWEAAGVIHSDIQRGFIRAEVIGFDDLVEAGGETQAKRSGKQRLEMRQYVMQDYDAVHYRFSR